MGKLSEATATRRPVIAHIVTALEGIEEDLAEMSYRAIAEWVADSLIDYEWIVEDVVEIKKKRRASDEPATD